MFNKCESCKKTKLFVKQRKLTISKGIVTSKIKMCNKCYKAIKSVIV